MASLMNPTGKDFDGTQSSVLAFIQQASAQQQHTA
jgi:hypothetical protein